MRLRCWDEDEKDLDEDDGLDDNEMLGWGWKRFGWGWEDGNEMSSDMILRSKHEDSVRSAKSNPCILQIRDEKLFLTNLKN